MFFLDYFLHFSKFIGVNWWWVDSAVEVREAVMVFWKSFVSFEKSFSWLGPDAAWRLDSTRQKYSCTPHNQQRPPHNTSLARAYLTVLTWLLYLQGEQDKEERWADVQKKIIPWRLGIQEPDPELQLAPAQRAARLGKLHGALLVVASLIDKPTNLGGAEQRRS